jgi:hypothetical protein
MGTLSLYKNEDRPYGRSIRLLAVAKATELNRWSITILIDRGLVILPMRVKRKAVVPEY